MNQDIRNVSEYNVDNSFQGNNLQKYEIDGEEFFYTDEGNNNQIIIKDTSFSGNNVIKT